MATRLSTIYGLNMYTTDAEYIGEVKDIILNTDKGGIMSLCFTQLKNIPAEQIRDILKDSINYSEVTALKDIILIKSQPKRQKIQEEDIAE